MTANQNPFCFKELKDLKRQMTKLHGMFTINNKCYLSIGVDAKIVIGIVIFIIIVMGANPPHMIVKRFGCTTIKHYINT